VIESMPAGPSIARQIPEEFVKDADREETRAAHLETRNNIKKSVPRAAAMPAFAASTGALNNSCQSD
jgi:hypothetical protein